MSRQLLIGKLSSLTEENKTLKKLVKSTEVEIKSILKRNQEESTKVKKLLEKLNPTKEKSLESYSQTKVSTLYLNNICELENKFFQIKELILELSVQNIAIQKKIERRNKKNKLLQDASVDYKERINSLVLDKVNYQEKIQQQKLIKETIISESLYLTNGEEPAQNIILRI